MAQMEEKTISPTHSGQLKKTLQIFPIAMPTQPSTNMFMNTLQPAIQPRSSSLPSPLKRRLCHSAWV